MDWKTAKVNFGRRESRSCFGARAWPVNWSLVFHTRTAPVFLVSDNYFGSAYLVPQDSRNLPKIQISPLNWHSYNAWFGVQLQTDRVSEEEAGNEYLYSCQYLIGQDRPIFGFSSPDTEAKSELLPWGAQHKHRHNINTCAAKPGAGVGGAGGRRGTIHRRDAVVLIHFVWGFLCGCDQADSFRFRSCLCWLNPGIERSSFRKRGKAFRCVSLIVARCCT